MNKPYTPQNLMHGDAAAKRFWVARLRILSGVCFGIRAYGVYRFTAWGL